MSSNVHKGGNRKIKTVKKTPLDVTTYARRVALCEHLEVQYLAQGCHGSAPNAFWHLTIKSLI